MTSDHKSFKYPKGSDNNDADEEDAGEDDIVPSSQDTEEHASLRKEFSSTGEKSSGEFYVPFSRGTFEDGFAELGSSQNFELRLTESQDQELLNAESLPIDDVNQCPSSTMQEMSPVDSPAPDAAQSSEVVPQVVSPVSSPLNVYVRESSVESSCSPNVRAKESSESLNAVPETEQEIPEEEPEEEATLTPDQINVTGQNSINAQVLGSGPEVPVDLDDSCGSEDITVIKRGDGSQTRKRTQDSCDTGGSGKKIRLASDESIRMDEALTSTADVDPVPEDDRASVDKLVAEEPNDPQQNQTLEVVDPDAGECNTDMTHRSSTTYPSNASPSSRASSCIPVIAYPYFVRFSVEVFNSVEQRERFRRAIIVNGADLSPRGLNAAADNVVGDVCQWMSDNGIPMSPQSSICVTSPSDDSLAYTADRSSSSSGIGLYHIGGPLARSSISAQTFHGAPPHEGVRPAHEPPPLTSVVSDPTRRSDAASLGRSSWLSGGRRTRTGDWMSGRSFVPAAAQNIGMRRQSPDVEAVAISFKKPELPLHKRSSASSSSSGVDHPLPPTSNQSPPRPSSLNVPTSDRDAGSRPVSEHGVESGSDLFDDQPRSAKPASSKPAEIEAEEPQQSRSETEQSFSPRIVKGPGARDVDPDTRTTYSYAPDVPVYAKWKSDKFFYAGLIIGNKLSKEKYKVMFDDQSEADVLTRDVIMLELLPCGTSVFADPSGRGEYTGGYTIISCVNCVEGVPPPRHKGYVIRHEEKRTELTLPRGRVSLSREAAQPLLLSNGAPQGSIATVSLDNIINTKRKSKVKQLRDSWVVTPPSAKRRGALTSPQSSRRVTASERGSPSSGRKSNRKATQNTPDATGSTLILDDDQTATTSSELQGKSDTFTSFSVDDSEISLKPTGRFGSYGNESSNDSTTSGKLFKDFSFLITGSETINVASGGRSDSPSRRSSPTRRTNSGQARAFDREVLRSLITNFGGQEIDCVSEKMLMQSSEYTSNPKSRPCILLIAPDYNRTSKFLQCLAANIPCIRHTWIYDSCTEGTLQPLRSYRLPRGIDILTQQIVPWNEETDNSSVPIIFENVIVAILTDDVMTFGEVWERILTLGGAFVKVLQLASVHSTRLERFRWLLYDDRQISIFTLEQLRSRPSIRERLIVPNFLIQCLLYARLFDPSDSESFKGKRTS